MKLTVDGIRADGTEYSYTAAGAMDGTDHPLKGTGMRNAGDTTSWKRIDRHTVEWTVKKEGKIVNTVRLQVFRKRPRIADDRMWDERKRQFHARCARVSKRIVARKCSTMRCSEPGVSVAVAIVASRGLGR